VIDAVAISSTNEVIASDYVDDIADSARNESLESIAMKMEAAVADSAQNSGRADIVCVDGSIVARLNKKAADEALREARRYGSSIFVAKSSESRAQFGPLGSRAGDIYYYNRVSGSLAGYSRPFEVRTPYRTLFEVYARLRDSTPMLRIELLGEAGEQDARKTLDMLCHHSVAGYPYCLKLAHNACKVTDDDIDGVAGIFSLQNEQGARDALNE
jgi:hypothetical protein